MKRNSSVREAQIIYEEATPEDEEKWMAELEEKYYYEVACARTSGLKEGERRGERRNAKKLAQKMLARGMSIQEVSEITGLNKKELENLLEQSKAMRV